MGVRRQKRRLKPGALAAAALRPWAFSSRGEGAATSRRARASVLGQAALDTTVGNEPDEGDEHVNSARDPAVDERHRNRDEVEKDGHLPLDVASKRGRDAR